ncbi:hypothetical protein DIZ27_29365 [Streptomyces sp. NWU339]|uniref:hypothetical protein n=1 Tax=Streptomyces sp. NWU339 TaxID=2185284 RepID=UPI000D684088|nr:hypothetical protein [Streptomyces sp. NWU339]PWI07211.1 hypothetical protein DIZ27_29365 [Streptomyces sp. NWU339]
MTQQPLAGPDPEPGPSSGGAVLSAPTPQQLRDRLAELVVRDLLGPTGDEPEELAGNPLDHYIIGRPAPASGGLFQLRPNPYRPEKTKYVHVNCGGAGKGQPTALPARFLVACPAGHMDDFPWVYFVHRGASDCEGNTLSPTESGTTGEAANVFVRCTCGVPPRSMADALGQAGERNLPACRGHGEQVTWPSP